MQSPSQAVHPVCGDVLDQTGAKELQQATAKACREVSAGPSPTLRRGRRTGHPLVGFSAVGDTGERKRECVDDDVSCVGCGYNLRTLRLTGRCPECGTDVVDSTSEPEAASPRWRSLLFIVPINASAFYLPALLLLVGLSGFRIHARDVLLAPVWLFLSVLDVRPGLGATSFGNLCLGICVALAILTFASYESMRSDWRWRIRIVFLLAVWSFFESLAFRPFVFRLSW